MRPSLRYLALLSALVVVALAGYAGYVSYPRFDLPRAAGLGLMGLAAAAGIAAFFSPCSFPLLATLLAREAAETDGGAGPIRRAGWISVGAAAFLIVLGLLLALGGGAFAASFTFESTPARVLRAAVGVVLVLLGLIQAGVLPLEFRWFEGRIHGFLGRQADLRRRSPVVGYSLFGFGYLAAGFG